MRSLLVVVALVACTRPADQHVHPAVSPVIDCARLPPCPPDLGVCLRCLSPDHPTWVWNAAPGSPWTRRVRPEELANPTPGFVPHAGHPFWSEPDCSEVEVDARGLPVRSKRGEENRDVVAWSYDARGRVVEERIDEVPFCPINDYGDEGPCGVPDGTWDRITTYQWRDEPDGGAIQEGGSWVREYDARGRLLHARRENGALEVQHEYKDDRLVMTRTGESTTTYAYDDAGRLVERQIVRAGGSTKASTVWQYDAQGSLGRIGSGASGLEYANTYRDGRLVSVRSWSRGEVRLSPPVLKTIREHDARGLVVRVATVDPDGNVHTEQRWIRDERGVPLATTIRKADYRCLAHIADRFLPR